MYTYIYIMYIYIYISFTCSYLYEILIVVSEATDKGNDENGWLCM